MKKIYVRAYCQSNLGDDLFVLQLARRFPGTRFYLYAVGEHQRAFRQQSNILLPSTADRLRRKLRHTLRLPGKEPFDGQGLDGQAVIGGSILWENAPVDSSDGTSPCFLIGANCDAAYSDDFRQRLGQSLARLTDCCFRDSHSFSLFRALPNVRWAPDVLFGWKPTQQPQPGAGVGISVVSAKGCFSSASLRQTYFETMAALIDLCRERQIPVTLLSFCRAEGDEEAIREILSRTADPSYAGQCLYAGDPEAMLDAMNGCKTIVATRFHAMILGWVLGKNVVPVIYSEKQTQVLADVGFSGPLWNAQAGQLLSAQALLDAVLSEAGRLETETLSRQAENQFAALAAFLE